MSFTTENYSDNYVTDNNFCFKFFKKEYDKIFITIKHIQPLTDRPLIQHSSQLLS